MNTSNNENNDKYEETLFGSNVMRYFPSLAKYVGGSAPALLLSQLIYWRYNIKFQKKLKENDYYFYISIDDMEEQTGLSRREQITSRRNLLDLGIVDISYKGRSPKTTHYKLNISRLKEIVSDTPQKAQAILFKARETRGMKINARETRGIKRAKRAEFNTETTTKNTNTHTGIDNSEDKEYKDKEYNNLLDLPIVLDDTMDENSITLSEEGGDITMDNIGKNGNTPPAAAQSGDISQVIETARGLGFEIDETVLKGALAKRGNPSGGFISEEEQRALGIYDRFYVPKDTKTQNKSLVARSVSSWDILGMGREVKNPGAKRAMEGYAENQQADKYHVNYGKFPPDLEQHIRVFVELSGVYPITKQDYKTWQSAVVEWREAKLTPEHIASAVREIKQNNKFRIASPRSVTGTAKAIMFYVNNVNF